jgi:hypothetical protein
MELQTYGARKYPTSMLMRSSAGLGWSAISAELRSHPAGETPVIVPQNVEVCLTVAGNDEGRFRADQCTSLHDRRPGCRTDQGRQMMKEHYHVLQQYDKPSSYFGQYGDKRVTEVGRYLDATLEAVLRNAAE